METKSTSLTVLKQTIIEAIKSYLTNDNPPLALAKNAAEVRLINNALRNMREEKWFSDRGLEVLPGDK